MMQQHRAPELSTFSFESFDGASDLSNMGSAQKSLSTAPQTFRLVWTLVSSTIAFAFCIWWVHLLNIIYERQGFGWGRVHLLFGFLIAYQILANYWTVSLTNPGYLKNERERGVSHWSNHGMPEGHSYCTKCNIVRPPRSHHCKRCNRCCLRMDHHCQFIDKCVGELNYFYYLRCVFWGFVFTLYGLTTTLFNMQHGLGLGSSPSSSSGKARMGALKSMVAPLLNQLAHLFEPSSTEAADPSASSLILRFLSFLFHVPAALFSLVFTHRQAANFMFFLLSGGFFAFIAPLIVYHVQLVSRGQTTVEHVEFLTRFKRQQSKRPASLLTKVFGDGDELVPTDNTEDQGLLNALRRAAKHRREKEARRLANRSSDSAWTSVQDGGATSSSSSSSGSESENDDAKNGASDDQAGDGAAATAAVVVNDCSYSAGGLLENAKQMFGPLWWRELLLPTPLPIDAVMALFH